MEPSFPAGGGQRPSNADHCKAAIGSNPSLPTSLPTAHPATSPFRTGQPGGQQIQLDDHHDLDEPRFDVFRPVYPMPNLPHGLPRELAASNYMDLLLQIQSAHSREQPAAPVNIEGLNQKIDTFARSQNGNIDSIDKKMESIGKSQEAKIDSLAEKVDSVFREVEEIHKKSEATGSSQEAKINSMAEKVDSIEDGLSSYAASTNAQLVGHQKQYQEHHNQLLERRTEDAYAFAKRMNASDQMQTEAAQDMQNIKETVLLHQEVAAESAKKQQCTIDAALFKLDLAIEKSKDAFKDVSQRLDESYNENQTILNDVTSLRKQVKALEEKITECSSRVGQVYQSQVELETNCTNTMDAHASILDLLRDQRCSLGRFDKRQSSFEVDVKAISHIQSDVSELKKAWALASPDSRPRQAGKPTAALSSSSNDTFQRTALRSQQPSSSSQQPFASYQRPASSTQRPPPASLGLPSALVAGDERRHQLMFAHQGTPLIPDNPYATTAQKRHLPTHFDETEHPSNIEAAGIPDQPPKKRGRGRPPGSGKKAPPMPKNPVGRPKGITKRDSTVNSAAGEHGYDHDSEYKPSE